ncbi:hypothetical protein PFFVO_06100, partial [Plasmodium falciparum Vietnam Oak-Knoll (FVO)]
MEINMEKQREILKRILTNKLKKREQERKMERQQKRESLIEKNKIIQKFIEINNDNNLYHNKYKSGNIRRFNKNITFYEKKTNISLCLKNQNLIKERENNGTYYLSNNVGYIKTNIYDMSRKNEKNEPQHFCDNERNKEIVGSTDFFSTHNNKDRNLNKYTLSHNKYKKYSPNKDRDILREETVFIKNNLQEEKIDKLNRKSEELNVQENYNNTKEKSSINAFNDLKKNEDKNKNNIGTSTQNRLDDICNNKCNDKFNTEKNNDKSLLQVDKLDYKEINCYHT